MNTIEVKVPDIGDFNDVPVIEVFVKPGDAVNAEDSLLTLESDKATMDVPSPAAGVVKDVRVKVGDKVSEGALIVTLEEAAKGEGDGTAGKREGGREKGAGEGKGGEVGKEKGAAAQPPTSPTSAAPSPQTGGPKGDGGIAHPSPFPLPPSRSEPPAQEKKPAPRGEKGLADSPGEGANPAGATMTTVEVKVPDIGDFNDVPVIEVLVKPGDIVNPEDPLVTLESDKATMDVPSPIGGVVEGVRVGVGDRVSEGTVILTLSGGTVARERASAESAAHTGGASAPFPVPPTARPMAETPPLRNEEDAARLAAAAGGELPAGPSSERAREVAQPAPAPQPAKPLDAQAFRLAHASPSVRKFARELGVDLSQVKGSGPKGRIVAEDVQGFVKQALARPAQAAPAAAGAGAGLNLLPWPQVDFGKYGPIEAKPLSRIRKISGANLARNWVMIPHVTQFDEADVTELEALRVALNKENEKAGIKVTMLAFLIKASVAALTRFPEFNASLDGESLVYKKYFNIGFAADTPNGLVVPVLKNADRKGVLEIAQEMAELSKKAREAKLAPSEMAGGCFSISSLGGIGGTAFTPIINAPEVAILGVSRSATRPIWNGREFAPRLMLPLSLSYDHRVIDGAAAARFTSYFTQVLGDFRRVVL